MKPTVFLPSSIITPLMLAGSLAMASGCASKEPTTSATAGVDSDRIIAAQPGAEIVLAPGEVAEVASANLRVRFNRVIGDSRCPNDPAVQCVWGGSVVIEVQAGPITGFQYLETRRLESIAGRDTTTIGGQLIRFLRVTPERRHNVEIPASSYRVVLQVGAAR